MSVDARVAVAHGLRRLVERDEWPTDQLVVFQNLLLDECGGDTRPLVMLLIRAIEQGIPEDIARLERDDPEGWRHQCIARLMANAFVQPDMARWVVHAWAFALGRLGAASAEAQEPAVPVPGGAAGALGGSQRWSPQAAGAGNPAVVRYAPPVQRGRFGLALASPWVQSTVPLSPQDRRRDRFLIGGVIVVLVALAIPAMYLARQRAPMMAADAAALADRLQATQPLPPSTTPSNGAYSGRYRVERTLESVTGDPSCLDGSAAVRWPVPTMETVAHDSISGTFQFLSRPEVRGRVTPEGNLEAGPIYGRKDGTDYAFWMAGRFTEDGFEARAETTTRTVISWLTVERCRLTGRLRARRVR